MGGDRRHRGVGGGRERLLRAAGAGSRPRTAGAGPSTEAGASAEARAEADPPAEAAPELTGLGVAPATFRPARNGPAILHRGRAGTGLRFRLSRAALVRFEVVQSGGEPDGFAPKPRDREFAPMPRRDRVATAIRRGQIVRSRAPSTGGHFSVRGRRGVNRLRFSGRVRGRKLAEGAYVLEAVAVDRAGRTSAPTAVRFRIGPED